MILSRRSALLGALALSACSAPGTTPSASQIGGPFTLVDTRGQTVTEADLVGKPSAVFFGFTYCPEVCPTTLGELTAALAALGPDGDKLNIVFVSVDPERDTPEDLAVYLSNFDSRIRGFTGTPEAVAGIAKAYRVYYKKIPIEGGSYTMDHSSMLYLMDRRGAFVEPVSYGASVEAVTDHLRRLARSA